jgi:hypothetical protein
MRSLATRLTRQSLNYIARPVQFAVTSRRPTTRSTGLFTFRLNPSIVRYYGHGPPPLTREFVQERVIDLLGSYDKVNILRTCQISMQIKLTRLLIHQKYVLCDESLNTSNAAFYASS